VHRTEVSELTKGDGRVRRRCIEVQAVLALVVGLELLIQILSVEGDWLMETSREDETETPSCSSFKSRRVS